MLFSFDKKTKYKMPCRVTACCLLLCIVFSLAACQRRVTDPNETSDTAGTDVNGTPEEGQTQPQIPSESVNETETAEKRVKLPLLDGMTLTDAVSLLDGLGLKYVISYGYSSADKNTVTGAFVDGTKHERETELAPSSTVLLEISLGRAPQTESVKAVDEKTVYLTFDDGPSKYTDEILETLKKYDVKATFFTVGMFVGYYPERVRAVVEAGHLIACHTETHDLNKIYESPSALLADIKDWEGKIEKALGYVPERVLFRFPGGSNNSYLPKEDFAVFYNCLVDNGYMCYDWSMANNDKYLVAKPEDMSAVEYLKQSTVTTLKYREKDPTVPKIMLMHDSEKNTAEALPWIIEYLKSQGYKFATLDELDGDWLFRLNN